MFVRHWMTSPAVTLPTETPAVDALEVMLVRRIRRIPVLGEGGSLAGIVTRDDLQRILGTSENSVRRTRVTLGDIMTPRVRTVAPEDPLERAARIMLENDIAGLPVMQGDRVVGMITESDIFAAFTRIMGLCEPGGRIVLTIPEGSDLLEALRTRTAGVALRSLAAYPAPGGGWEAVARVRGRRASAEAEEPEPGLREGQAGPGTPRWPAVAGGLPG
jgi:acetoin utilization protein AcuB